MKFYRNALVPTLAVLAVSALVAYAAQPASQLSTQTIMQKKSADPGSADAVAIFAGGCFWCMEPPFDKLPGVKATISGYTAGRIDNPTYKEVSRGRTGHTEAIKIVYDPDVITYGQLLEVFWINIDPFVADRQFCDRGSQYRAGIYFLDDRQRQLAEASKSTIMAKFDKPIVTEIEAADTFWPAEEYHQDYYLKNPYQYKFYRFNCGRDQRLKSIWG